eukprot:gene7932-10765_t
MLFTISTILIYSVSILATSNNENFKTTSSLMRFMWTTPIQLLNIYQDKDSFSTKNIKSLNDIERSILNYYKKFLHIDNGINEELKNGTLNDRFYNYQQALDIKYKLCIASHNDGIQTVTSNNICMHNLSTRPDIFTHLALLFSATIRSYLMETFLLEKSEHLIKLENIFIWCSVHANGSYHQAHHHASSVLSGVFYITSPPKSGSIVFEDPRGSHPPFGKTLEIQPKPGDLVLFPSWLIHRVSPTLTNEPRISISFNLDGDWETTTDINQGYITSIN